MFANIKRVFFGSRVEMFVINWSAKKGFGKSYLWIVGCLGLRTTLPLNMIY